MLDEKENLKINTIKSRIKTEKDHNKDDKKEILKKEKENINENEEGIIKNIKKDISILNMNDNQKINTENKTNKNNKVRVEKELLGKKLKRNSHSKTEKPKIIHKNKVNKQRKYNKFQIIFDNYNLKYKKFYFLQVLNRLKNNSVEYICAAKKNKNTYVYFKFVKKINYNDIEKVKLFDYKTLDDKILSPIIKFNFNKNTMYGCLTLDESSDLVVLK